MIVHTRRAFTMIELLIVVGMLAVGVTLLPGPMGRSREAANRIKCASNLRQLCLSMKMYANGETRTNAYPRTKYDANAADKPVAYTKPDAQNPFAEDGPDANDVTAAFFLNLRTQEITTDVFICPSSAAAKFEIPAGKNIQNFSNFDSQAHLSYSIQNPYASKEGVQNGFIFNDSMSADFAIMADMNPGGDALLTVPFTAGGADQRKMNSPNHQREGQNVAYADGHVDWSASVWAGAQQDNIYTFQKDPKKPTGESAGIAGSPAGDTDSVLLPVYDTTVKMPNANTVEAADGPKP